MSDVLSFRTELYRRDAVDEVVRAYASSASITRAEGDGSIVLRVVPTSPDADAGALRASIANDVLRATVRRMHDAPATAGEAERDARVPTWALIAPYRPGTPLGLGWVLDSVAPVRDGSAVMLLHHPADGTARVAIHRNVGAPLGVAHTDELDFLLMNGGSGASRTNLAIASVLVAMTRRLAKTKPFAARLPLLAALRPHAERQLTSPKTATDGGNGAHVTPTIDPGARTVTFDLDESRMGRLPFYDALLGLTERVSVTLDRPADGRIGVTLTPFAPVTPDALATIGRDAARALASAVAEGAPETVASAPRGSVDVDALVRELADAAPLTLGVGYVPARGPGHDQQRVLNLRGTGACNSDCIFCIEKFNATHRAMPAADATRELIRRSAGDYDMLFFASGEPTIHPKLFEYASVARASGFRTLGMSSHFRTFADPVFARRTLEAGFQFFDISLHAADAAAQLEVNPIGDDGRSLEEALKGLAVLYRLADALGIRISVTHKIVVSRLNVEALEPIVRATYDRGVRHFILQPIRATGLAAERQAKLAITEEEILPHVNRILAWAETLPGAVVKPYGFSRQALVSGAHVETEQNRVKNIYGRAREEGGMPELPDTTESRPTDGRHWVEVMAIGDKRFGFPCGGEHPVLDAALERGAELPFGCRMGSCGMCSARLLEGTVDQSTQAFLTEAQMRSGIVLLCQARPRSDVLVRLCGEDEIDTL